MIKIDIKHDGIEYAEVRPIGFKAYAELAGDIVVQDPKNRLKILQRKRLLEQVTAYDASDKPVKLDDLKITQLPRNIGIRLVDASNMVLGTSGAPEILSGEDADGVTSPILMKLSQPLKTSTDEITELEFMAKTFGDIEAAYAETHPMRQAVILIESIARPVLSSVKLQALPSWAVNQLSVVDGSFIAENVMPRFLE